MALGGGVGGFVDILSSLILSRLILLKNRVTLNANGTQLLENLDTNVIYLPACNTSASELL